MKAYRYPISASKKKPTKKTRGINKELVIHPDGTKEVIKKSSITMGEARFQGRLD
tara:strand:- start:1142 stop:1306 length:165 start_codon:yes stop_codon:yes gene_type:complete